MQLSLVLLAALLPVIVLLVYIYWKDRVKPEPRRWLLRTFIYGVGSALAVISLASFIPNIEVTNIYTAFASAFLSAAIPEETAKLVLLWLVLKKNPHFDEQFDGIVYAACVGLGFAALENVLYLVSDFNEWVSVGIGRALFAVPGHFFFAVLMGYYLSLYHFGIKRNWRTRVMIWLAPVLAHGLYDGILMAQAPANQAMCGLLSILFFYFFYSLAKLAKQNISLLAGK